MLSDDGYIRPGPLRRSLVWALREAGEARPEAMAWEIAAILSRKHERIHLHGLFHGLTKAIDQQLQRKEGADAELRKAVAAIRVSEGRGEELRVPNLAEATTPLSVWAAVHELASYAHSSKNFDATVRKVLEEQKHNFHGETATRFLKIADGYSFPKAARDVRNIMKNVDNTIGGTTGGRS
jgi:hypothetical protein